MSFELVEGEDGETLVRIAGDLDMTSVGQLASAVDRVVSAPAGRLIVDIAGVRFADSSAIALWVRWATAVPDMELRGASPLLTKVLTRMGLAEKLGLR